MNKHNILGSVLLGCMLAFIVVMPAFASEREVSERSAIKTCVKTAQTARKASMKSANVAFKLAERSAIMTWKSSVDAAKGLEQEQRREVVEAATETMRADLKAAREAHKTAEKTVREGFREARQACMVGGRTD